MPDLEPYLPLAPLAIFALGSLAALVDRNPPCRVSHAAALAGSLVGAVLAIRFLILGASVQLFSLPLAPFATIGFRLDPLSAYFLLVIYTVGAAASVYALGYLKAEKERVSGLAAAYNGFLAAMALVVLADSVFAFLFAWESMSLVSFFLVVHNHREEDVRRAGFIYLVMTHASAAFLLAGFLVLSANAGSLDFASIRAASGSLPPFSRDLVFLMALIAFGTKAGIVPLHVWLPRAHPAAPSHVSALMSGVMIKTAIYGLLRVTWDLAGTGPAWWGGLVILVGVVSAVLGVLYALMEHDLKKLLAYHSVENIGIILMGLGTAMLLRAIALETAAAIALIACLYHVLNHAVFKGLLFLGAGAVQHSTHTRDMEKLGGLIRRMPWTAGTFLIGAAAISALPPLNGFVSEWLTFQSLLALGASGSSALVGVGAALAAGALALTGGLAAFCFVKAFGVSFLGMPRSDQAAGAHEASQLMLFGMVPLAILCVVLGVIPVAVVRLLAPVTDALVGRVAEPALNLIPSLPATTNRAALAPLAVLGLLVGLGGLALLLGRLIGARGRTRIAPTWVCGIKLEPGMQYSATALAKPVRIIFQKLVRPYREVKLHHHGGTEYFVSAVEYEAGLHPVYERYFYTPVVSALLGVAQQVRALQNGSIHTYLAYIFATLIAVLLLTR